MLVAIDVGNTETKLGYFAGDGVLTRMWRVTTESRRTPDEYGAFFTQFFEADGIDVHTVDAVAIASVVPHLDAILEHAVGADLTIASAAVSDWRPAEWSDVKLKKTDGELVARMQRNPDVLAALGERKGTTFLVGFAAETDDHEANAREKLQRKNLDAIVVNDVRNERGFGTVPTTLTLLYGEDGRRELGFGDKAILAARLLDATVELMEGARAGCD